MMTSLGNAIAKGFRRVPPDLYSGEGGGDDAIEELLALLLRLVLLLLLLRLRALRLLLRRIACR